MESQKTKMKVNELCFFDEQSLVFPKFPEAKSITSILVPFAILTSDKLRNDICYCKWQELCKNIDDASSINDIYKNVWCPLHIYCSDLIDSLQSENVTLARLGELFGSGESADTEQTINRLYSAVLKCRSLIIKDTTLLANKVLQSKCDFVSTADNLVEIVSIPSDIDFYWIKELAQKIDQWSSLDRLTIEADMFINTLTAFGISGSSFTLFSKLVGILLYTCTYIYMYFLT